MAELWCDDVGERRWTGSGDVGSRTEEVGVTHAKGSPWLWRKSSYSGTNGECVEVAFLGSTVAVRDSRNPNTAVVSLSRASWRAFLGMLRAGGAVTGRGT
ncbi:DUF397 domain-containing protein [Streptomyces sp. NPDC050788]|uniref:DUF397 domain-containing protein n=1 Tax=Streptomyces sp. NPDC050788 TaxID=3155041 RepID=UPI0034431F5A